MDDEIAKLDHTSPDFEAQYGKILNFIHYEVDQSVLKSEFVKYCKTIDRDDIAEQIPVNLISIEGKIAYCLNRGAKLKPSSIDRINQLLNSYEVSTDIEFEWQTLPVNVHSKSVLAYVDCYSQIDNAKTRVLKGKLDIRELASTVRKIVTDRALGKTSVTKQLFDHYKESLKESKNDPYVSDWVKPLSTIVDTLNLVVNNKASVKSGAKNAKARKMASTYEQSDRKGEKAASKVTYKDADADLGINSVDPTNLVGASSVVIYNTKNRHCEVYFAADGKKLSVQGARITNFDETKSIGKTLRHPETDLPHWTRATSVRRLELLLSQIKGKSWTLNGKFNRNTMILKVL